MKIRPWTDGKHHGVKFKFKWGIIGRFKKWLKKEEIKRKNKEPKTVVMEEVDPQKTDTSPGAEEAVIELEQEEEKKYPYFDKPFIGKELRHYMWQLTDPFTYHRSPTEKYTPPINYVTDGYSIPKGFRWLVPKGLPAKRVPTLHDWFCEQGKKGTPIVTDKTAHEIFGESLKLEYGISTFRKKAMAWAVKKFGPKWDGPK